MCVGEETESLVSRVFFHEKIDVTQGMTVYEAKVPTTHHTTTTSQPWTINPPA